MSVRFAKVQLIGSLTDIVEMDAASNNSVEDIRAIREEVNFLPTKAKYRVYIIDEVHMLSQGAFNALLKTLEEPPEHVKFILATNEPQKLPATILSRCQRFDFKRISNDNIIKRLKVVCSESNIQITDDAMHMIAVLAEGAMRDALSILERCVQDGENKIDENKIRDLVGIPKITYVHNIGAAFSLFEGARWFFIITAIIILNVIYLFFIKDKTLKNGEIILYSLLISGIIGNLIDRILFGYVIDFIDVNIFNFAIFNLADSFIVIAVILLLIMGGKDARDNSRNK